MEDLTGGAPNGSQAPSPPAPVTPIELSAEAGQGSAEPALPPDPTDSDSIRYWDGVSWTDHIARESQSLPTELPPLPPPPASARVDLPAGIEPPARVEPPGLEAEDGDDWAERVHAALTKARTVDSSASWRDAMQATAVVSAMAQTLLMAAEARETAEQLIRVARTATETDTEVRLAAEREAQASSEALEAARIATKAATHAKQAAERSAEAVPGAAQAARIAEEAATAAQHNVQALDAIVAKARETNTPAAWIEALQLAVGDLGDESIAIGPPRSLQADGDQPSGGTAGA